MERAPLRPVPARPPSPIDPAEAVRHVSAELSALDAPAAEALALVALAGRSRDEVAGQAGLTGEQLAGALTRARKALRRRLHPLPGSGWCERAERLISDRLDDALEDPGPARLEVHLANCSRCVEHERRLAQAQEALVTGFVESTRAPPESEAETEPRADADAEPPDEPASAPAAALRIVDPGRATAAGGGAGAPRAPDDAADTPPMPEPATLRDEAPIALPPAEEAPALPDPDEPEALPEAEDPAALPYGEPAPAIAEREDSPVLAEAGEPGMLAETEEPAELAEAEEPGMLAEAGEPAELAEAEEPGMLAEAGEPAELAEAEEPGMLAEAGEPAELAEAEEPAVIAEVEEPAALAEAEEPAVIAEVEEPAALAEAEEPAMVAEPPAGQLADVVPMPAAPRPPTVAAATAAPAPLDRGRPPTAQHSPALTPTPARLPRRSPSPTPEWSRLAAIYAPASGPDGSQLDDTLSAVGPLLAIFTLGLVMLVFAVLAVGI